MKTVIINAKPGTNVDHRMAQRSPRGHPCRAPKLPPTTMVLTGALWKTRQYELGHVQGTTLTSFVIGEETILLLTLPYANTKRCNSCRSVILLGHPGQYMGAVLAVEIDVSKVRHSPLHPYRRARLHCRALKAVYQCCTRGSIVIDANVHKVFAGEQRGIRSKRSTSLVLMRQLLQARQAL